MGKRVKFDLHSLESLKKPTNLIIGDDSTVGPRCIIYKNVKIGRGSNLRSNIILRDNVSIGKDVTIGSHVIIGVNSKIQQKVIIENRVSLSAQCIIYNNAYIEERSTLDDKTVIGAYDRVYCTFVKNTYITCYYNDYTGSPEINLETSNPYNVFHLTRGKYISKNYIPDSAVRLGVIHMLKKVKNGENFLKEL